MDTGGLLQHIQMSQQRLRCQHRPVLACLDQHLVDAAIVLAQGVLHISQLLVQSASLLHPELLYSVLHHYGLEADAESAQQEEADKEDLAGMFLNDVSQLVQFLLYFAPDPQRGFVSCGPTLKINCWIIRKMCEGTSEVVPGSARL